MMESHEVKPCLYCGQANALPVIEGRERRLAVFVRCFSCGAQGAAQTVELGRTVLDILTDITAMTGAAVEFWNMRARGNE